MKREGHRKLAVTAAAESNLHGIAELYGLNTAYALLCFDLRSFVLFIYFTAHYSDSCCKPVGGPPKASNEACTASKLVRPRIFASTRIGARFVQNEHALDNYMQRVSMHFRKRNLHNYKTNQLFVAYRLSTKTKLLEYIQSGTGAPQPCPSRQY